MFSNENLYNQLPVFYGTNYAYWKARMKSHLKAIDEQVWVVCERGWTPPTVTANNITNFKPVTDWTENEFKWSTFNSRGQSEISGAINPDKFRRIMTCTT